MVGYAWCGEFTTDCHAFLYSNGTMTDLGTPPGYVGTLANSINASGQVVGYAVTSTSSNHAFLYSNGTFSDLGALGGSSSAANGINDRGQVVGWAYTSTGWNRAFLYSNGTMSDLGTLGGTGSGATAINDSGQVVGGSNPSTGPTAVFLYSNGTMMDLNSLIITPGWDLEEVTGINDSAQICGWGYNPAGQGHAFLLTPIPEPSTIVLLLASAACLLGFAWRRRAPRKIVACLAVVALALSTTLAHAQVSNVFNMPDGEASLSFVTVGNPGNAPDPNTGYGAVGYTYDIGQCDVTIGQYCQFLNAVAATDTYGLYNSAMSGGYPVGIVRRGLSGSYTYSVSRSGFGWESYASDYPGLYPSALAAANDAPVFDVTWGDAARFCNWLQNGQPSFLQGNPGEIVGSTETGAYTLNGATSNSGLMAVTRNAGATYFIPSENEWYKAAYYNPANRTYWTYATQSNSPPSNVLSATGTNNANFDDQADEPQTGNGTYTDATDYLTPVGVFASSPGPYGTFDMGGDVTQWTEANVSNEYRCIRGSYWALSSVWLMSSIRYGYYTPSDEIYWVGFRVASVPEPGSIALLVCGAIAVLMWWKRRR